LIIYKNSANSISPVPSSSTDDTILVTSFLLSAIPKDMSGSSSSSVPIAPTKKN
jgi:hypothetical protein